MYKMFIDDIRNPSIPEYEIVRSSADAINMMKDMGCPGFISFDHDLGGDDTSMAAVNFLIEADLDSNGEFIPPWFDFYVHSSNPSGKINIESKMNSYLRFKESEHKNSI